MFKYGYESREMLISVSEFFENDILEKCCLICIYECTVKIKKISVETTVASFLARNSWIKAALYGGGCHARETNHQNRKVPPWCVPLFSINNREQFFIIFCICPFTTWYTFFMDNAPRIEECDQYDLDTRLLKAKFLSPHGEHGPTHVALWPLLSGS